MRHLGSLVLGIVSAPILWVLTGLGWARFNFGLNQGSTGGALLGFVVLIAAALLLAALLLPRWSPLGPAAAGGLFMVMALWALIDINSIIELVPRNFLGTEFALTIPVGALSVLIAIPLIATVALPHRWRGNRPAAALYPGAAGQSGYPPFPPPGQIPPPGQVPPAGQYWPAGQYQPGAQVPAGGQFPPGGPAGHPPNYGPAASPNYGPSASPGYGPAGPPNYGSSVPPNYGPTAPVPPNYGPTAPSPNIPPGTPHYGPAATPGQPRTPGPQAPGSPISGPPVPGTPTSAPPVPPTFSPPSSPAPARPNSSGTDETTQFTGGPDDDGTDGATRRLGDDTRPM
jgi:hypothetical protein